MAKLMSLSINLSKITKERLIQGDKGVYLNITVALNDEEDNYGNTVSCWQGQTKEQRESDEKKNYLGNGKVIWSNDSSQGSQAPLEINEDDLPF